MIDPTEINQPPEAGPKPPPKNLDIACGDNKMEGWIGIDIAKTPAVDIQHDLFQFPWPIEDSSIDEARCSHFFEHVPARLRPQFMSELWRILKPGAGCLFITPRGYERQVQDLSHEWPPIVIGSYLYYDRAWLRANKLDHYIELFGINCDFEPRPLEVSVSQEFSAKSLEHRIFAINHYANAPVDLVLLMVKREQLG
jgi:SAM-dependent methyltransferase